MVVFTEYAAFINFLAFFKRTFLDFYTYFIYKFKLFYTKSVHFFGNKRLCISKKIHDHELRMYMYFSSTK